MSFFLHIGGKAPLLPTERRKLMNEKIIAIYCLCDDLLKATNRNFGTFHKWQKVVYSLSHDWTPLSMTEAPL